MATLLLLSFALAVALPLIPLKLADPFWQLTFTAALCSNGFLPLLAVLKTSLLAQLQAVEQRARATRGGQLAVGSGSLPGKALDPAKLLALGKDCLRVVLLSLGLALAFAAAAQRKGTPVSLLAEWSLAAKRVVEACHLWQQQLSTERQQQGSTASSPRNAHARKEGKRSTPAGARSNPCNRGTYADYFETPASEQGDGAGD